MKRCRIVEESEWTTDGKEVITFYPEYRFLWIWWRFTQVVTFGELCDKSFSTKEEAEKFINSETNISKIVHYE